MNKIGSSDKKISAQPKQAILLIGDWLLDEHWVTGTQSISTSTRTGDIHRFVYNDINHEIIFLSGAGRVADILLREEEFELYGIGIWEKGGEEVLESFFTDHEERSRRNEFRVNWKFPKRDRDMKFRGQIHLRNLYAGSKKIENDKIGTKRAIRIYEKIGPAIRLTERIDFMKSEQEADISLICNRNIKRVLDTLKNKNINAIIIKDMDHGTITDNVVNILIESYSKDESIKWFISSKRWKPTWLKAFSNHGIPIELLMIPQTASREAIKEETNTLNSWITQTGWVTLEALEFVEDPGKFLLNEKINAKRKLDIRNLVLLPEQDRVIAYKKGNATHDLFIQPEAKDDYSEIDLPMASVYFPQIIKGLLSNITFEEAIINGLSKTISWRNKRYNTIKNNPAAKQDNTDNTPLYKKNNWKKVLLKNSKNRWEQAFKEMGIVNASSTNKNDKRFELWRGMTTLGGYICLSKKHKSEIRKLLLNLKREKGITLQRAEVCFIKAKPGSGKSYLVECLAKELGLKPISFNLSQIPAKAQLVNCFDEISTAQAENKHKPLLIFFDEMNTYIEQAYPYSLFLAPLEDGYYLRDTHKFRLSPSIWIFVGTEFKTNNKDKASDFKSRLTLPIVDLMAKGGKQELELDKLEKLYYCVNFIRKTFKEVTEISMGALKILSEISPEASPRNIRKFVESFEHIPFEQVDAECIKKAINRHKDEERVTNLFERNKFKRIFAIKDNPSRRYVLICDKPYN
jgi:hypothetical protein